MRQETFRQHHCAEDDRGLARCEGALPANWSRSASRAGLTVLVGLVCSLWTTGSADAQAQKQTPESLLRYAPTQKSVEYDTPDAAEIPKCTVSLEQGSYVVTNAANQVLRKFTDSNGDGFPDMYRYYHLGLEVYREIDTNGDFKAKKGTRPDQYRWMNWGGTRWGLDPNEDGKIDSWKVISAQESARVAVEALINGDLQALSTVMINEADIKALGLPAAKAKEIQAATSNLAKLAQDAVADSKILNSKSQWMRFDPPVPGLVLAEQLGTSRDLTVYENAMAYVQNGEKLDLISVGEMVQVGDVWKLLQVPAPINAGNNVVQVGGILMTPGVPGRSSEEGATPEMSAEMQKLLADLQKIDEASPQPDALPKAFVDYNVARANVSEKLISLSRNDEERQQWIQQFTDSLSTATQSGMYPEGLPRLISLQEAAKNNEALLGYIYYRRLMAEYAVRLKNDEKVSADQAAKARDLTQKWWFDQLEGFATKWPNSEDAPDAVVQLAISYELMGRIEDAKAWYTKLAKNYPETEGGAKAQGAMRRLTLTGNPLVLSGKSLQGQPLAASQYKGKVLLVVFWASYAQPFTDDLKTISAVYAKHQKNGFEILGVNMDTDLTSLAAYMKEHGITWQSLREAPRAEGQQPGDFNYGINSVPTMFIVNKEGIVEGGITAPNLDFAVDTLIQGKKLEAPQPTEEEPEVASPKGAKRDATADKSKARQ